jgi:hypothetical protein
MTHRGDIRQVNPPSKQFRTVHVHAHPSAGLRLIFDPYGLTTDRVPVNWDGFLDVLSVGGDYCWMDQQQLMNWVDDEGACSAKIHQLAPLTNMAAANETQHVQAPPCYLDTEQPRRRGSAACVILVYVRCTLFDLDGKIPCISIRFCDLLI